MKSPSGDAQQWDINGDPLRPNPARSIGSSPVTARVRPQRLAFAVDDGDCVALKHAFAAAATIWGGIRSPILVVEGGGCAVSMWSEGIADCIGFDAVVDLRSDASAPLQFSDGARTIPIHPVRPLDAGQSWSAHALAAIPPIEVPGLRAFAGSPESLIESAGAGCVATPGELALWTEGVGEFKSGCTALELVAAQASGQSLLEVAAHQDVDWQAAGVILESVLFVAVAADDEDFVTALVFWNYRALRPRIWADGKSVLLSFADAHTEGLAAVLADAAALAATTPRIVLLSDSVGEEDLWQLVDHWGFQRHQSGEISERLAAPGPMDGPINVGIFDPIHQWFGPRTSGSQTQSEVAWSRPNTAISVPSPVTWSPSHWWSGAVCFTLDGDQFDVPRTGATARLYHPNSTWDTGGLRLLTNPLGRYDFWLNLPEPEEILAAGLDERGFAFRPNDKATQIQGVLAATRDRSLFRRASVISTIQALTATSSRDLTRQLGEVAERGTFTPDETAQMMAAIAPSVGLRCSAVAERVTGATKEETSEALDHLVREGLVERGFQTKCDVCGLKLFADLQRAASTPHCAGCGSRASLVVESLTEPVLHYRLGSLLQRLSLNGGLAPLAAACLLLDENSYVVPGADLNASGESRGEVDLIGWKGRTVFVGEAKMSAVGFDDYDFAADWEHARDIGANQYLLVCLQELGKELVAGVRNDAIEAGVELRVLDSTALLT